MIDMTNVRRNAELFRKTTARAKYKYESGYSLISNGVIIDSFESGFRESFLFSRRFLVEIMMHKQKEAIELINSDKDNIPDARSVIKKFNDEFNDEFINAIERAMNKIDSIELRNFKKGPNKIEIVADSSICEIRACIARVKV